MVWSHGGGYTSGAASAYDAQRLADKGDVIVVTVNNRLGVFGYLACPGWPAAAISAWPTQIAAAEWAQANAAAFGGDPRNMTLFGESDGAMSACALLTSPQAAGLVDKVAMSSGGTCLLNWPENGLVYGSPPQTPYVDRPTSEALGMAEAKTLGCAAASTLVLACMRKCRSRPCSRSSRTSPTCWPTAPTCLPRTRPPQCRRPGADIPVLSAATRRGAGLRRRRGEGQAVAITDKTYPAWSRPPSAPGRRAVCPVPDCGVPQRGRSPGPR